MSAPDFVDAHLHLWSVSGGEYRWLTEAAGELYGDFPPERAAVELAAAGVTSAILVQADNTEAEPLADRNPQKFMDIYQSEPSDFQKATHKIYHDTSNSSYITVSVLK